MNSSSKSCPTLFSICTDNIINIELTELARMANEENPDYGLIEDSLLRLVPGKYSMEGFGVDFKEYNSSTLKYKEFSQVINNLLQHSPGVINKLISAECWDVEKILADFGRHTFSREFCKLVVSVLSERERCIKKVETYCEHFYLDYVKVFNHCKLGSKFYIDIDNEMQDAIIDNFDTLIQQADNEKLYNIFFSCWNHGHDRVLLAWIDNQYAWDKLAIALSDENNNNLYSVVSLLKNIKNFKIVDATISSILTAFKKKNPNEYYLHLGYMIVGFMDIAQSHRWDDNKVAVSHKFCNYIELLVEEILSREENQDSQKSLFEIHYYEEYMISKMHLDEVDRLSALSLGGCLVGFYREALMIDGFDDRAIRYIKSLLRTTKDKEEFVFNVYVHLNVVKIENGLSEEEYSTQLKKISVDIVDIAKAPDMDLVMAEIERLKPKRNYLW